MKEHLPSEGHELKSSVIINRHPHTVGIILLVILFLMSCMKWLIEGILDRNVLEVLICLMIYFFYFAHGGSKVKKMSLIWVVYIINIFISLLIHESTFGLWGRAAVTALSVGLILIVDEPIKNYKNIMVLMMAVGIIVAGTVVIHYLTKDSFNRIYVSMLNETAAQTARLYIRSGYYFGLLYNPHEPAGLIAFSIVAILTWKANYKSKNLLIYIIFILLGICLLLTGKKAVLICALITLLIVVLCLYGTRKQVIRGLILLAAVILLIYVFIIAAISHPEIAFFNRFNILFYQLLGGGVADSGRILLYQRAIR